MKTLGEVLTLSIQFLKEHQVLRARRAAEDLFASALGIKRIELYMLFDRPIEERELVTFRGLLKRKIKGEPLEYILGEVPFFHCQFQVTPAVLIPRPETEILLSEAHKCLEQEQVTNKTALDLCCGSGCLGISLKKALPGLTVVLSDISSQALEVAKDNAQKNNVDVLFLQGDLLVPFQEKKADFILCNPPYVSEAEYAELDRGVRDFEPKEALVGGVSGLEFYERLSRDLPACLHTGAKLFFELGSTQAKAVEALFFEPWWKKKRIKKDWAGHDRFFFLEFQ